MAFSKPIDELIQERFSCRTYRREPIDERDRRRLQAWLDAHDSGPFGSPIRFELVAADRANRQALRGLGTYGFIKSPAGFIVGAMGQGERNLEDFGYGMEQAILFATELGLGSCWLGGTFTKSSFAQAIEATDEEAVPAIASVGYEAGEDRGLAGQIRQRIGRANRQRLPWERIFFRGSFGMPLARDEAGAYATVLEMVRLGPSASNKQPWRILKQGTVWHLYIQRTPGYRDRWVMRLMGIADMQRLDAGVAMCHFELMARELGLEGSWALDEPEVDVKDELTEYVASWKE
jgi:hypothetical protein